MSSKPSYHTECTGEARKTVETVQPQSEEQAASRFVLFGVCFCPLEADPTASDSGVRGICESTVIMDYLLDRFEPPPSGQTLLPPRQYAYERSLHRIAADRVNRTLIPAFYRYLQAQEPEKQIEHGRSFVCEVEAFIRGMDVVPALPPGASLEGRTPPKSGGGCWDGSSTPGWVDFMAAPWLFRATNVLKHFRGLEIDSVIDPSLKDRWLAWQEAVLKHPAWTATVSTEQTYLESYVRYAENRPNTSQVANAINEGRGLP